MADLRGQRAQPIACLYFTAKNAELISKNVCVHDCRRGCLLEILSAVAVPVLIGIASATIHSRGRDSCSGLVFACDTVLGQRFSLVSLVSINLEIWFYEVEMGDAGETIEREENQ